MFQKYKIIDANTKHSIFLESIHLHSDKRVLIHKIITSDSNLLKNKLLKQQEDYYHIAIKEYYQSQHALFVILEDAYPLIQVLKTSNVEQVAKIFLQLLEISKQRIKLFHSQLFLQSGQLKIYSLGGADQSLSCLYNPPQFQYRLFGQKEKQPSYVWNLGVVFSNCLNSDIKQQDYNRKYKQTLQKIENLTKTKSKLQSLYYLIKCMLKYSPSERISWSIVEHSLKIIIQQSELQRFAMNSQKSSSFNNDTQIVKNLLNNTNNTNNTTSMTRNKSNRLSFIYKTSTSPHRKLKSSKSGMDITVNSKKVSGYNKSLMRVQSRSTLKPIKYYNFNQKIVQTQDKAVQAKSFLEIIEDRRKKSKQAHSFLIKNDMFTTPPNESFSSMNMTQMMQDSISKDFQFSMNNSTQSTKRPSFKRNNRTQQSQKQKLLNDSIKDFLQYNNKNANNFSNRTDIIQKRIDVSPQKNNQIIPQINQNLSKPSSGQKQNFEVFEQIQSYSESNNTIPLQALDSNKIMEVQSKKQSVIISSKSKTGNNKQGYEEIQQFLSAKSYHGVQSKKQFNNNTSVIASIRKSNSIKHSTSSKPEQVIVQKVFVKVHKQLPSYNVQTFEEEIQEKPIIAKEVIKQEKENLQQQIKQIKKQEGKHSNKKSIFQKQQIQQIIEKSDTDRSKMEKKQLINKPQKSSQQSRPSSPTDYKKMLRAFNLLGQVVKHANINLKAQRNKWMVQCFLIYKCYWSFRLNTVSELKKTKKMQNIDALLKDNENITLGFNSMYNVVTKVASKQESFKQNKDIITMAQLSGSWKPRFISVLNSFFKQMLQIVNTERIHLVSKDKFKVLLKFVILVGVAILIIDQYKSQNQQYSIVDTYTHISIRLSETQNDQIILSSFTQQIQHKVSQILPKYN